MEDTITILRQTVEKNRFGETIETWKPHYTTKARIYDTTGSRRQENGEFFHSYQKAADVWMYVDVKDTDRVEHDGKVWIIDEVVPDRHQIKKQLRLLELNE